MEAGAVNHIPAVCCSVQAGVRVASTSYYYYTWLGASFLEADAGLFLQPSEWFHELPKTLIPLQLNHLEWIQLFATKTNSKEMSHDTDRSSD